MNIKSVRIQPLKGLRRAADTDGSSGQQLHEGSPSSALSGAALGNPHLEGTSLRAPPLPAQPHSPSTRNHPATATTAYPGLLSFMPGSHPTQPAPEERGFTEQHPAFPQPLIGTSLCQRPGVGSTQAPWGFQGDRGQQPRPGGHDGGPGEDYEVLGSTATRRRRSQPDGKRRIQVGG